MGFIVIQWDMNGIYPLVNIQKTMESHYFYWVNPLFLSISMVIFNSYVCLPEGNVVKTIINHPHNQHK